MYKVILWDVDGTLLDFGLAEKSALRSCFEKFKLGKCTDDMVAIYSQINKGYWERIERGEISKQEALISRFRDFFESQQIEMNEIKAFNREYLYRLSDTIVYCDNSKGVVRSLKGKVKQYIISNGTVIAQTRKLKSSGFDELVDGIFLSEQIGYEKPSKEFFEPVMKEIGDIPKSDVLVIGDSLTSDIRGGNNAGFRTCWYNPKGRNCDQDVTINHEIHELKELYRIL